MRTQVLLFGIALGAFLRGGDVTWAQGPRRMADIPLYPGSRADTIPSLHHAHPDEACWDDGCKAFIVAAPIEQVFSFYRQRLVARPLAEPERLLEDERDDALDRLRPGGVTPALFNATTWNEWLEAMGPKVRETYASQLQIVKKRPAYRPGDWLFQARFVWGAREPAGEARLAMSLDDVPLTMVGANIREGPWTAMQIHFEFREGVWEDPAVVTARERRAEQEAARAKQEAERAEKEEADRSQAARVTEIRRRPPSERDLGVPLYPGAVLQVEVSASNWPEDGRGYFFLSSDAVAKVVAFYQQRTGKKAVVAPDGSHLFVLQGAMPEPEASVTVFPNTIVDDPAPTVIGFYRRITP